MKGTNLKMKKIIKYITKKLYKKYSIRFFFDYAAGSCLWAGNKQTDKKYGNLILNFKKLGLSNATIQEIKYLASVYETSFNDDNPYLLAWDMKQCADFDSKSQKLFERISNELPGKFELIYEMHSFVDLKKQEE